MAAPNIVNVSTITGITTGTVLTTTSTTTLLTNSASSNKVLKLNSILVTNNDSLASIASTVSWYTGSTDYKFINNLSIPPGSSLIVLGKDAPIYLQEGQSIRGGAGASSKLDCIISYEEIS